jgi:ubiquinone/menaquinone biosynthesis C-methylase UbiE
MIKNLENKVNNYFKTIENKIEFNVPNETVFRLMGNYNYQFKNKNCLDLGIGHGDNLLEFKRRGANIFGVDIRKNIIKNFIKKNKLNSNNFFYADLNDNFPFIDKKMNFVICKDTLYYLTKPQQFKLFKNVYDILDKEGYFLFQYIVAHLKPKKKNLFGYDLIKDNVKLKKYFKKKNPITFLDDQHILKLLNSENFKLIDNTMDICTHVTKKNKFISVNKYFLLMK